MSGQATPTSMMQLARPLAGRIAAMAGRNFLIAGLIARSHGLHDKEAADPERLTFTATVDSALAVYLERLSPVAGLPAERALTALAFAEAPGLSAGLWQLAVEAIDGNARQRRGPDPVRPIVGGQLPGRSRGTRPPRQATARAAPRCTSCSTRH